MKHVFQVKGTTTNTILLLSSVFLAFCSAACGSSESTAHPIAVDDPTAVTFQTQTFVDVLANDSVVEGVGGLTIESGPVHGAVVVHDGGTPLDAADDQLVYTPRSGFAGEDALVYRLTDTNGASDTAQVSLTVSIPDPVPLVIPGVGPHGIFDPSLALDPITGLLWMSYSEVTDSAMWPGQNLAIHTRLAWSGDAGGNWTDSGSVINPAVDVVLPLAPPNDAGTWEQEVSTLVHDPGAVATERWKLLWLRYMRVNGVPAFQHSWLAMRTAPTPDGPWSVERKLFVGLGYDAVNDVTLGPPEVRVHQLDPELSGVLGVAEPGFFATADTLYVALLAAEGGPQVGRIALLKWPHPAGPWQFCGSLLVNATDAPPLGFDGFSAPEIFEKNGELFLIVTPQTGDFYQGTQVFKIQDLDTATLQDTGSPLVPDLEIYGIPGTHNGAAGYIEESTASGLIYSEVDVTQMPLFFQMFKSLRTP